MLIIASHGSGKMPRSVHADRGQKEVLQWRNDTPVAQAQGCDLWSRWEKALNGVADVTKRDADQLTCEVWTNFWGQGSFRCRFHSGGGRGKPFALIVWLPLSCLTIKTGDFNGVRTSID